jgi:hypothetical protein
MQQQWKLADVHHSKSEIVFGFWETRTTTTRKLV